MYVLSHHHIQLIKSNVREAAGRLCELIQRARFITSHRIVICTLTSGSRWKMDRLPVGAVSRHSLDRLNTSNDFPKKKKDGSCVGMESR